MDKKFKQQLGLIAFGVALSVNVSLLFAFHPKTPA